jgi:hypothetical protein
MAILNILWPFGIFYDHWVLCVFIWYSFSGFGIMHQEKSGNPAVQSNHPCPRDKKNTKTGRHRKMWIAQKGTLRGTGNVRAESCCKLIFCCLPRHENWMSACAKSQKKM